MVTGGVCVCVIPMIVNIPSSTRLQISGHKFDTTDFAIEYVRITEGINDLATSSASLLRRGTVLAFF